MYGEDLEGDSREENLEMLAGVFDFLHSELAFFFLL